MVPWRHGGHRAEGYCNYDLSFGSWALLLSLSLLLCYLKSLVGGMGWDGMGWDGEGIKNLGTWALYVD